MEPVFKPVHALCVLLCLVAVSFRGSSEATTILADYGIFLSIMIVSLQLYYAWVRYISVRNLEALDKADRRFYLSIPQHPDHQAAIERRLESLAEETGIVEQFLPSPALRQLLGWAFWSAVLIGGLPVAVYLGTGALGPLSTGVGAIGACAALWMWVRLRSLRHSIEVSPFGISEVHPDGSRRRLAWQHVAGARAFPRRRVVRLYPTGGHGWLSFSYDTTRIGRLVDLIVQYGPQGPSTDPTSGDTHPSDSAS